MTGPVRRTLAVVGLVLAFAVAAAGCGVPTSTQATALSKNSLPFTLTHPAPTTTIPPGGLAVHVYLVDEASGALYAAARTVPPKSASLDNIIALLLAGPTPVETVDGVTTYLTGGVQATGTWAPGANGTKDAVIDFNEAFASISGANQVLAVSQVVYTTAAFLTPSQVPSPTVQVTFEIDHQTIAVPIASGAFVERPVTVADYLSLAPGS